MNIKRVVPNITSARLNESRAFYTEFLGFQVVMDMDWIITLASSTNPTAQISLVRGSRSGIEHQDISLCRLRLPTLTRFMPTQSREAIRSSIR